MTGPELVLGIETSCDDTAAAVVRGGTEVLSQVKHSQGQHATYGGVVPELAARLHAEMLPRVVDRALAEAGVTWGEIDAVAVTQGPGLQPCLLVGTTYGSVMAQLKGIPLVPVHHIHGHIASVRLNQRGDWPLPALCLTVAGGHTQLHLVRRWLDVVRLGQSRDDALGEVYDKTAKYLGLGYPGGPIISQLADQGDGGRFALPRPYLGKGSLEFSFSGLKAAVKRHCEQAEVIDDAFRRDMAASFQRTVEAVLIKKLGWALAAHPAVRSMFFAGGVSANRQLRALLGGWAAERGLELGVPSEIALSTDNAAMIAASGWLWAVERGLARAPRHVEPKGRWEMGEWLGGNS